MASQLGAEDQSESDELLAGAKHSARNQHLPAATSDPMNRAGMIPRDSRTTMSSMLLPRLERVCR
ncbi:hypothetical protein GCM10007382_04510 [Salinibacterium xinjiangense]|uniref:Uncharacterized protein n=1 Tax=Salinibacterium xinjiangense TaxID=386302 RepID=A0A2C8ZKY2_9MICO|nr:hypothetical protein [Salinibacterium xinjiangense]GGK87670.1 hypothetical protein GCM10007382_04510 [Salinibacterium xinjiangense]SOE65635.1 hypothetical protein SAMN06296378_1591 [Salinibacterium xinjiangense]